MLKSKENEEDPVNIRDTYKELKLRKIYFKNNITKYIRDTYKELKQERRKYYEEERAEY